MDGGRMSVLVKVSGVGTQDPQGTATTSTLAAVKAPASDTYQYTYQYGTTTGQGNVFVCQERTLTASGSEELNLNSGALLDLFGATAPMQTVRLISMRAIANASGTTQASSFTVGGSTTDPNKLWFGTTTATQDVYKDGPPFIQGSPAGVAVASTQARVKVTNNDTANVLTYSVFIVGRHT